MAESLDDLIEAVLPKFGSKQALADACGMTPSGFGRGMSNNTMTVGNLLTFAKVGGVDPLRVLRAAGKTDVADRIEDLFGASASKAPVLSRPDRDHLSLWNALPPQVRATFDQVFRIMVEQQREQASGTGRKVRRSARTA
ncbi:MAG TPA: hypothetical protein VKB41_06730 [Steroidobacteraceae bacterium]|nr:hypothetical protein [Steroidobacteraceae bacterium]